MSTMESLLRLFREHGVPLGPHALVSKPRPKEPDAPRPMADEVAALLLAEVRELRRLVAERPASAGAASGQEPPNSAAGELRRLSAEVQALQCSLPPQLVTIAEAAEVLGVSVRTLRRRIKAGDVPTRRLSKRSVRVDLAQLRPLDDDAVARLARETRNGHLA